MVHAGFVVVVVAAVLAGKPAPTVLVCRWCRACRVAMAASNKPVAPRSPGSVSERDAETRAGVEAVETYLEHHHTHISWQVALNNHACTRPKKYGGPLVHSLTNYKTFLHVEPGSASAAWRCSLDLPQLHTV